MLTRSPLRFSFVRGGFSIYSKHQKHQAFAPAPYLYRFPGKRGPGPILMKYWHTLGQFPTGLEVPFRLDEFHQNYIRQHVPAELEDWLRCVVYDPADTLTSNMEVFLSRLQNAPLPKAKSVLGRAQLFDAKNVHAPLQKAFDEFGIEIPVIAVRAIASTPRLKEDMLDVCFAYRETVAQIGSTPHRRWAALATGQEQISNHGGQQFQKNSIGSGGEKDNSSSSLYSNSLIPAASPSNPSRVSLTPDQSEIVGKTLASVLSFPVALVENGNNSNNQQEESSSYFEAAPDEVLAAKMLTTLAEGCHRGAQGKSVDAAAKLLEAALNFAQDDPRISSATHTNLSSAYTAQGNFQKAELHAKEALMRDNTNPRAYAAWSVATALQDDLDSALRITSDALQEHPTSDVLQQVNQELMRAATGRTTTPESARGKRYQLASQCNTAMRLSGGKVFENGFDWAIDPTTGARINLGMDRMNAGIGSAARRAPEMGSGPLTNMNREER